MADIEQELPTILQEHREKALKFLARSGVLSDVANWFGDASNFLSLGIRATRENKKISQYQVLLLKQAMRMQRYYFALSHLSWEMPDEAGQKRNVHAIDGYFPILKSAFEVGVEFDLTILFKQIFEEADPHWDSKLGKAIENYTNFTKKNHNHKFWFRDEWLERMVAGEAEPLQMSNSLLQHLKQGKKLGAQALKESVAEVDETARRSGEINHWFPIRAPDRTFFVEPGSSVDIRPKGAGSMKWRCQTILGNLLEDKNRAQFWSMGYDSQYDILNRYSHPAQGYDDNFRHELERFADLFRVEIGALQYAEHFFLPTWISDLGIPVENSDVMAKRWEFLKLGLAKIMKDGLPVMVVIDSTDYLPPS